MDRQKVLAEQFIANLTQVNVKSVQNGSSPAKIDWAALCFQDDSNDLLDSLVKSLPNAMLDNATVTRTVFKEIVCPLFTGPKTPETTTKKVTDRVFSSIHKLIKSFLSRSPHVSKLILTCLKQGTPYHASTNIYVFPFYIGNILLTSEYLDQPSVIQFVTDKLFLVDVCCLNATDGVQMQILDRTLHSTLNSIEAMVKENGVLNLDKSLDLLDCLFHSFRDIILPSTKCIGSHFAIFYLASLHKDLSGKFVDNLLSLINGEMSQNADLTTNVVMYLASYLCTSMVASVDQAILFIQWCVNHLQEYLDGDAAPSTTLASTEHKVFYITFQAVLDVICARHNELIEKHLSILKACDFQRLVNSPLNPLAVCSDDLLSAFLPVSSSLRLAFCSAIIHRNCRSENVPPEKKLCHLSQPFKTIELASSSEMVQPYMRVST